MTLLGFDHVQLAMPPGGEAAARAFYGGVLGLTEVPKPEPMRARGGLWFEAGPVAIHLGIEDGMRASAKAHPAVIVDELAPYLARIAAAGHAWREATELAGVQRGHVTDPFGNRIELIEVVAPAAAATLVP
jgi:catechol 2,3-dioxygenase-like lactoylglutathione lyase family enzyme